jgi:hypothetical protein
MCRSPRPEGLKTKPNTENNPDIPNDISQKHRLKNADKKEANKSIDKNKLI